MLIKSTIKRAMSLHTKVYTNGQKKYENLLNLISNCGNYTQTTMRYIYSELEGIKLK